MVSRKKKSPAPLSLLRQWRQRLTSRMACFVWGAIFGNAVLSQPINPLNLLLKPPEYMLSETSRGWLESFRESLRQFSGALGEATWGVLRDQAIEKLPLPAQSLGSNLAGASGSAAASAAAPAASHTSGGGRDFSACAHQFPSQRPLPLSAVSVQWVPVALCSDAFAVLYSGLSKTPLLTVEKLHRQRLQQAAGLERTDQFYPDARIPASQRAQLSDYQGSGYDRGHLAAAANQPSAQAMAQSFALSNMVPQDPTHNRKLWSKLEADTRKYVQRASGNVFVYSGSLFEGQTHTVGTNAVWIPSHLFKLVYDEAQQRAWGYVLPNHANAQISRPMDYASFVQRTQWDLLQGLPVVGTIR